MGMRNQKTVGLFIVLLFLLNGNTVSAQSENNDSLFEAARLQLEVLGYIQDLYVEEKNIKECSQEILKGGISRCTDPYSYYLNLEQAKEFEMGVEGKFVGVGFQFEAKKIEKQWRFVILAVFDKTPAQKAGLKPGDILVAVSTTTDSNEKISLRDKSTTDVANLVRGAIGTQVTLFIYRDNKELEFKLTRAEIKVPTVKFKEISQGVGYVSLMGFGGKTVEDFDTAVTSMTASNMKVLIIDVRNNPGGLLSICIDILSLFSDTVEPIVYAMGRSKVYDSYKPRLNLLSKHSELKIVVLVNEYSASASEILAGWLKEDFGASVIGEKTFGKGSIQSSILLSDKSRLHLTIAEYFVGRNKLKVHNVGVVPTIEIKNPELKEGEELTEENDAQLQKAIEVAEEMLRE